MGNPTKDSNGIHRVTGTGTIWPTRHGRERRWALGLAVALGIALPVTHLTTKAASAAATLNEGNGGIKIDVDESCLAPENPPFNACSITGSLPGQGIDGADINWEVTLFFDTQWRIQFQAFSEEPECVYPMKVKGAYEGADVSQKRFNSTSGMALGLTPEDHPELSLIVDFVRIRTTQPNCG